MTPNDATQPAPAGDAGAPLDDDDIADVTGGLGSPVVDGQPGTDVLL